SFKPKEGAAPDEEPFIPEDLRVRKQIGTMVYATKDAVPSEDEQGWLVCAVGAVPGKLAVITVAFVDRADEDWARRVSETIRPPGGIGG
ncbi:MAG: hypothetical protein Q8L55_02425, partial [Phycisphaerales bacterium]|nr:hypothetical protein [Phycisphaerales bacterium]